MKRSRPIWLVILLVFSLVEAHAAGWTSTAAVSTTLTAHIGQVLQFSLDTTNSNSATLIGYLAPRDSSPSTSWSNLPFSFDLRSGTPIDIGSAHIFSNMKGSFMIQATSRNGGRLLDPTGIRSSGFDYDLIVDGSRIPMVSGAFSFVRSGKSTKSESVMRIGIYVKNWPASLLAGMYSDQITFTASVP
jgi:hypothetical protein